MMPTNLPTDIYSENRFDTCVKSLLTKAFENIHERRNYITNIPRRVEKGVSDRHLLL